MSNFHTSCTYCKNRKGDFKIQKQVYIPGQKKKYNKIKIKCGLTDLEVEIHTAAKCDKFIRKSINQHGGYFLMNQHNVIDLVIDGVNYKDRNIDSVN